MGVVAMSEHQQEYHSAAIYLGGFVATLLSPITNLVAERTGFWWVWVLVAAVWGAFFAVNLGLYLHSTGG